MLIAVNGTKQNYADRDRLWRRRVREKCVVGVRAFRIGLPQRRYLTRTLVSVHMEFVRAMYK